MRTLKQALNCGYLISDIRYPHENRILVICKRRFPTSGNKNIVSFWIDRKYFSRNYPATSERFSVL